MIAVHAYIYQPGIRAYVLLKPRDQRETRSHLGKGRQAPR